MEQTFNDAVYLLVAAIPAGRVSSYGRIAQLAGYPRHARAVGALLRALPADSALPWHRVVRSNGEMPQGERQRQRLQQEQVPLHNGRVAMALCQWPPASEGAAAHKSA